MFRHTLILTVILALPVTGKADAWALGLFDKMDHDWGVVARGTVLTHRFTVTNNTGREVRLRGVRVSCHCTTASANFERLGPGQSGIVDAVMETRGFIGSKSVTVFVGFDRPHRSEAALRVSAVSSGNIAAAGGEVDFGVIPFGSSAERKLNIDNPSQFWSVVGMDHSTNLMYAEISEPARHAGGVRYELKITLNKNAPAGRVEDRIRLRTNDPQNPEVVVVAHAKVEPRLVVTPDHLRLDNPQGSATVTRNLIVRAPMPFRVTRVENTEGLITVRSSTTPRTAQLVLLTVTMPRDGRAIPDHVTLVTDLDGEKEINVRIVP